MVARHYEPARDRAAARVATTTTCGSIPATQIAWQSIGGGESGWATPDPVDNNIIWSSASGSGSVGGIVERFNLTTGQGRNVEVWPDQVNGSTAAGLKYRFVWTMPLA